MIPVDLLMCDGSRHYGTPIGRSGVYVPEFAVSLWQIEFRERYGIDVDREVARVILQTKYEESTWKWKKAISKIEEILVSKGLSRDYAMNFARHLVDLALE